MSRVEARRLYGPGVLAVVAVVVFSGCTDTLVSHEAEAGSDHRVVEAIDGTPFQHRAPADAPSWQGRLAHRYSDPAPIPSPDSLRAPGGGSPVPLPLGRITERYRVPLSPDSLQLPVTTTVPGDSTNAGL